MYMATLVWFGTAESVYRLSLGPYRIGDRAVMMYMATLVWFGTAESVNRLSLGPYRIGDRVVVRCESWGGQYIDPSASTAVLSVL